MNVSCTSCSAKYGIPDEKVRGKKVKITCKHCGTAIVVDGTTLDAPAAAAPGPAQPAAAPATAAAKPTAPASSEPELSFDIAYPDERQETLPLSELVAKYTAGTLGDDAFVWREGMTDWKAPRDVPEIASALAARKASAKPVLSYDDDEATRIQVAPLEGVPDDIAGEWREPAKEAQSKPQAAFELRASAASPKPAAVSAAPAAAKAEAARPAAARRSAARGGGDLFGDLAAAGSEEDESLGIDAKDPAPKLTGARNESSVLFSLDALVKQEQKPAPKKPAAKHDDTAAILMGEDASPNSIANVGTGSFGSAFAAPDFSAPVTIVPETRAADASDFGGAGKKRGVGVWIALAGVLIVGGGAAAMVASGKLAVTAPAPSATEAAEKPEPKPEATTVTAPAASAEASAAASASAAAPSSGGAAASSGGAPAAATGAATAAAAATKPSEAAAKPSEAAAKPAEKPTDKPAEKPAEAASAPFDTDAAKTALGAAAGNASSCKTADGPTGSGKVSVTFMPSGRATNTQVSGDLAGTAVGGCVAKLFRSAKVPPFSGDPVTVSKSFTVQ